MNIVQLAIRTFTFGLFGRRAKPKKNPPAELIDTQEREDTRARYFAACEKLERQAEKSIIASDATMELHGR